MEEAFQCLNVQCEVGSPAAVQQARAYAESLHWGIRWEGLRSKWFSRYGRWAEAEECLARLDYLEREYAGEVKQGC